MYFVRIELEDNTNSETEHDQVMKGLESIMKMLNEHYLKEDTIDKEAMKKQNKEENIEHMEQDILIINSKEMEKLLGYSGMIKYEELKQVTCDICHNELVLDNKNMNHIKINKKDPLNLKNYIIN